MAEQQTKSIMQHMGPTDADGMCCLKCRGRIEDGQTWVRLWSVDMSYWVAVHSACCATMLDGTNRGDHAQVSGDP